MFRNAKPYVCSELQAGRPGWTTVLSCVFISFMFALNMLGDLLMCQLDDKHECWHVWLSNASLGYSQQLVSIANWTGSKRWRWDPVTHCVSQCCLFYVSDDVFVVGNPYALSWCLTPVGHISITSLSKHLMFHFCELGLRHPERRESHDGLLSHDTICALNALNWKKSQPEVDVTENPGRIILPVSLRRGSNITQLWL